MFLAATGKTLVSVWKCKPGICIIVDRVGEGSALEEQARRAGAKVSDSHSNDS
jgi:hypothetical protein